MKNIEMLELQEQDIVQLRNLFLECNDYFQLIDGVPVCGCRASTEYEMEAVNQYHKLRYGIYLDQQIIGSVFAVEHYRYPGEFTITLLLLAPAYRGMGYGRAVYEQLEGRAKLGGFTKILVGVDEINADALKFWQSHGFVDTGERQNLQHVTRSGAIIYLEKVLR